MDSLIFPGFRRQSSRFARFTDEALQINHPSCFFGCSFTAMVLASNGIDRGMTDKSLDGWKIFACIEDLRLH
jgi:hypothetical protein